jgi:hypothetical protein
VQIHFSANPRNLLEKKPRGIRTGTRDAVKEKDGLMSRISCIQAVEDTLGNTLASFSDGKQAPI